MALEGLKPAACVRDGGRMDAEMWDSTAESRWARILGAITGFYPVRLKAETLSLEWSEECD